MTLEEFEQQMSVMPEGLAKLLFVRNAIATAVEKDVIQTSKAFTRWLHKNGNRVIDGDYARALDYMVEDDRRVSDQVTGKKTNARVVWNAMSPDERDAMRASVCLKLDMHSILFEAFEAKPHLWVLFDNGEL